MNLFALLNFIMYINNPMKDDFKNSALGPGSLLVFTSEMDPFFWKSVVLLLKHDQQGSLGVVINKPELEIDYEGFAAGNGIDVLKGQVGAQRVFLDGGPVDGNRLFFVHENSDAGASSPFTHFDTAFPDCRERAVKLADSGAGFIRVAVGYAGWNPGRLESEIQGCAWRVLPFDGNLVFRTNFEDIFPQAGKKAGLHEDLIRYIIDPSSLQKEKGGVRQAFEYLDTIRPQPA